MNNEIEKYHDQGIITTGSDDIIQIAEQAEARVAAVVKIKRAALMVTNGGDWVDQNGKPYLMASGAEKVANLFNISWRFLAPEPVKTMDADGENFTYTYSAEFSMGTRSIQVEGSRSSKDKFFMQYEYGEKGADGKATRTEKSVYNRDNERDVKMAALTNLLGNGITRLLGIRNLSYADLQEFAGISPEMIGKVEYKSKGEKKEPIKPSTEREVNGTTRTEAPRSETPGEKPEPEGPYISEAQAKRFWAIAHAADRTDDQIHVWLKDRYGINSTSKIPRNRYDEICTNAATKSKGEA